LELCKNSLRNAPASAKTNSWLRLKVERAVGLSDKSTGGVRRNWLGLPLQWGWQWRGRL